MVHMAYGELSKLSLLYKEKRKSRFLPHADSFDLLAIDDVTHDAGC